MDRSNALRWRRLAGLVLLGVFVTLIGSLLIAMGGLVVFIGVWERQWLGLTVLFVPLLLLTLLKTGLWLAKVPEDE